VAAHSDLTSWLMPPVAQKEWLTLTALLDQLPDRDGPPPPGAELTEQLVPGSERHPGKVGARA
jgi:hypothetical protein